MDRFLTVATAFAPGVLWLWFLHRKDRLEPEPWWLVAKVFVLGCVAASVQLAVRPLVEPIIPAEGGLRAHVVDAFVVTGACEEIVKIAPLLLLVLWLPEFDEPTDGIVYGVAAGLGFASVENVVFVDSSGTLSVVLLRAFTATLAHAGFSGSFGFFLGRARFARRRAGAVLCVVSGVGVAVGAHGLYDLFLFAYPKLHVLSLLGVLPAVLVALGAQIRWAQARAADHHPDLVARAGAGRGP